MGKLKEAVKHLSRALGYEIVPHYRLSTAAQLRQMLLHAFGVSMVLDVGANEGQYARGLRQSGYQGRIFSFEPLAPAYAKLEALAATDPCWTPYNYALGDFDGDAEINIAGNSQSSSLLPMRALHEQAAPASRYTGTQAITVRELDSVLPMLAKPDDWILLKIDTQGFEKRVLDGASNSLTRIGAIQLEMSFAPLYEGELLFGDMYAYLTARGYDMIGLEPGFTDPESGRLLQGDGLFRRKSDPL